MSTKVKSTFITNGDRYSAGQVLLKAFSKQSWFGVNDYSAVLTDIDNAVAQDGEWIGGNRAILTRLMIKMIVGQQKWHDYAGQGWWYRDHLPCLVRIVIVYIKEVQTGELDLANRQAYITEELFADLYADNVVSLYNDLQPKHNYDVLYDQVHYIGGTRQDAYSNESDFIFTAHSDPVVKYLDIDIDLTKDEDGYKTTRWCIANQEADVIPRYGAIMLVAISDNVSLVYGNNVANAPNIYANWIIQYTNMLPTNEEEEDYETPPNTPEWQIPGTPEVWDRVRKN